MLMNSRLLRSAGRVALRARKGLVSPRPTGRFMGSTAAVARTITEVVAEVDAGAERPREQEPETVSRTLSSTPVTIEAAASPSEDPMGSEPKSPAEMDATRFRLDPSVEVEVLRAILELCADGLLQSHTRELLNRLAGLTSSTDSQAAAYWAYHLSRFSFFVAQAAAGLTAHHVTELLGSLPLPAFPGSSTSSTSSSASSSSSSSSSSSPSTTTTSSSSSTSPKLTPLQRLSNNALNELTNRLTEAIGTWEQDLAWIRAGVYKLPWDMTTANKQYSPFFMARKTLGFMSEATATLQRRMAGRPEPLWLQSQTLYPEYYNSTYHYQTDGWLSDRSASIYEHSTEVLFMGRQDAMQRSALVPLSQYIRTCGRPQSELQLLEIAAGTGRFHTFIKDNWPEVRSICSDLSPFYLQRARRNLREWKRLRQPSRRLGGVDDTGAEFVQCAAEQLSVPDASVDMVVCVYLFHEVPEESRRKAVAEMHRVLKPGGIAVLTDSVQYGDRPEWNNSIGLFSNFNEPYYESYIKTDLGALFETAGFVAQDKIMSSATKTLSFMKPLPTSAMPSA